MLKTYRSKRRRKINFAVRSCYFCLNKTADASYKEVEVLTRFLSSRGKILARSRSGACARHQKKLGRAIKIARINALLPFKESVS